VRRRQFTLLLLLIAGIALWLSRHWWLPSILDQLPVLGKKANLIQAIEALVNLVVLAINGMLAYLLWLAHTDKRDNREANLWLRTGSRSF
jgi:hypothetical protein